MQNLKLVEGQNIEVTVDPRKLPYDSRKAVGRQYFRWITLVESLKLKYYAFMAVDFVVFLAGLLASPFFFVLLLPLIPLTLKAQFVYGDKLDDKEMWESKFVTRVDCISGPNND